MDIKWFSNRSKLDQENNQLLSHEEKEIYLENQSNYLLSISQFLTDLSRF